MQLPEILNSWHQRSNLRHQKCQSSEDCFTLHASHLTLQTHLSGKQLLTLKPTHLNASVLAPGSLGHPKDTNLTPSRTMCSGANFYVVPLCVLLYQCLCVGHQCLAGSLSARCCLPGPCRWHGDTYAGQTGVVRNDEDEPINTKTRVTIDDD